MAISRREKSGAQSIISCMAHLVMVDMNFILMTLFGCGKIQVPDLLQGISGGTSMVICHVLTLEKSDKKSYLIQFPVLPCNYNGYKKQAFMKERNYENMNFAEKGSSY